MLRPRTETTLPATQSSTLLPELPTWNSLTPVEELPQKLYQLRQARQQINRMLADAEGQVLHFLRKGPLAERQAVVKQLIERFYPFTASLLENHYMNLTAGGIGANACTVELASVIKQHEKNFKPNWCYLADGSPFLRKLMDQFHSSIDWESAPCNVLIGWDETLIRRYAFDSDEFFTELSLYNSVQWNPQLLRAFSDRWEYSSSGLLCNPYLPWDDDTLPDLLTELYAAKYEADNEEELDEAEAEEYLTEAKAVALKMKRHYWSRHSADRFRDWTPEYLRQNAGQLDWQELSANPALPFSFALLTEFAEDWDWNGLSANYGLYQKVLQPLLSDNIVDEFLTLYKD